MLPARRVATPRILAGLVAHVKRPLRVVHCPVNTAGVPWTNVRALRRRGVDASLVVFNRYTLHPEADRSLELEGGLVRRQLAQWKVLAELLPRTDLFHFTFGLTLVPSRCSSRSCGRSASAR